MINLEINQFLPILGNTESNLKKLHNFINESVSDIIIFPELATSGYFFTAKEKLLENSFDYNSLLMKQFIELAESKNKIIIFGFPELEANKIYNSAAILFPDKKFNKIYRKTHLFYKEKFVFEFGDTGFFNIYYPPFEINIGTMICYDWRFPESARTLALKGVDLIACPSNLVTDRWREVMKTRAFENKVYLAVANRIGSETIDNETLTFKGYSSLIDYEGNNLFELAASEEAKNSFIIEPQKTRDKSFNSLNSAFNDRRPEFYDM